MAKTIQKESKIVYLQIGQNYEHLAETKQFDVSEWVSEFPDATIYMLFKRPGEEAVAPVQTTLEDGILTWTISNWETGVLGVGFAEIRAIDSSTGMVKKSHVIPCSIEASVTDEDAAPDYPSWVDRMLRYGENVESIYEGLTDAITEGKAGIEQVASDTLSETKDALDDKAAEVLAEIPPTYTEVLEGIAKQYDSTKYYQKYEFVWHDGKIYLRLNNSSSPVGAWNPDDWSSPTDFATSMFELRYDMDWEKKLWDAMKAALYKDYVGYYDSQSSYNAGDVVWKDNANTAPIGFYRAKVDITPSSTYFVPANWDRLLGFDEQITDLKSALNAVGFSLSNNPNKTQPNLFIQNANKQAYNNTTEGFIVKAFKIEKGKRYSCYGRSKEQYTTFAYSLVMMGIVYADGITLASGTVYDFDYSVGSDARTTPAGYEHTFVAENDGYIVVMDITSKYSNYVFSEQDVASIEQTAEAFEYCDSLNADIAKSNLFIYGVSNKIFSDTQKGFSIKAYRIQKGIHYSCYGNAIGSLTDFRYQVVVMGISYVDAISLVSGANMSFDYRVVSPSEYTTPPNYSYDFIAENDGFIILTNIANVYENAIFGEDVHDYEIVNNATTLFDAEFSTSEFKSLNDWTVGSGKISTSVNGLGNRATVNKSFSIENRATYVRFKTSDSSAKIGFGYESPAYAYGSTLCYADFSAGKIAICEAYSTLSTMPSDRVYKSVTLNADREYIAILDKNKKQNTFTLVDTLSGNRYSISTVDESTDTLNNEFAGGRQNGYPFVSLLSGANAEVVEWYITTPFYEPRIVLYGDSITEGDRLTNNAKRFADWLKDDFGFYNVAVSGMSGSNIDTVTKQIEDEVPCIKPKFVIVQIGTNGTNTAEKLSALKAVIESNGSIALFNHIPMISGGSVEARNQMIDAVETEHCLMDVATSVNNLAVTQNATLFADGAHPNEIGHSAMYKRFVIDTSIYHN